MIKNEIINKPNVKSAVLALAAVYGLSHLVPIVVSPLLTRYYTPADFGFFSNFQSGISFILIFIGGKYENSIILQKGSKAAKQLSILSTSIALLVAVCLQLLIFFVFTIADSCELPIQTIKWLRYLPITAFACHLVSIQNEWLLKDGDLRKLSRLKLVGSITGSAASLFLGAVNVSSGLIISYLVGQIVTVFASWKYLEKIVVTYAEKRVLLKMLAVGRKNISHPRFSIPAQLLNNISGWMVVLFVNYKFGVEQMGYYALIDRVLSVPLSLFGMSVRDILKSHLIKSKSDPQKSLTLIKSIFAFFVPILIVFSLFVTIFGAKIFPIIFGGQWREGARLVVILVIPSALSCLSTSSFCLINLFGRREVEFRWQLIHFSLNVLAIVYGLFCDISTMYFVALAVARSISFSVLFAFNLQSIK